MRKPKKSVVKRYDKEKSGIYGELGHGDGAQVRFIQTAFGTNELSNITLISNIPGSEKWPVRDLFQRDVDKDRVKSSIIPYFQDTNKVKFFNPLTFILLPMDEGRNEVDKAVDYIEGLQTTDEDGEEVVKYERAKYHSLNVTDESWGVLKWNSARCHLVAIDGQHRLSALQRISRDRTKSELIANWKIPCVILNIYKQSENANTGDLLDIVRKIFVYINSTAKTVHKAREILLNDESVNAICVQELIQHSHENDVQEIKKRDESIVPLMFFDWRGEMSGGRPISSPASVVKITEVHNWFENYILGDDGHDEQIQELELEDLMPPLNWFGHSKTLTTEDSKRIREQFSSTVMPGLSVLFKEFKPFNEYTKQCRELEKDKTNASDIASHAFMRLRFGQDDAPEELKSEVQLAFDDYVNTLTRIKNTTFDELLCRDIGMRGLIYAFSKSKQLYYDYVEAISWKDFAEMAVPCLNQIYDDGWFRSHELLGRDQKNFLTHLAYDDGGEIVNYKVNQVPSALGPLYVILIYKFLLDEEKIEQEIFSKVFDDCQTKIRGPIERGMKKRVNVELQQEGYEATPRDFRKKVNELSKKRATSHLKKIAEYFSENK